MIGIVHQDLNAVPILFADFGCEVEKANHKVRNLGTTHQRHSVRVVTTHPRTFHSRHSHTGHSHTRHTHARHTHAHPRHAPFAPTHSRHPHPHSRHAPFHSGHAHSGHTAIATRHSHTWESRNIGGLFALLVFCF